MGAEAIAGIEGVASVHVLVRHSHLSDRITLRNIKEAFERVVKVPVTVYDVGLPADRVRTVFTFLDQMGGCELDGRILVKDCDNFFRLPAMPKAAFGRLMAVVPTQGVGKMLVEGKCYVGIDEHGFVRYPLQERGKVQPHFACGLYGWDSVQGIYNDWDSLKTSTRRPETMAELLSCSEQKITTFGATGYQDWGTLEDWEAFKRDYRTIFLDLDGVLFEAGHRDFHPKWGENAPIDANIGTIQDLWNAGKTYIVITTSRRCSEPELLWQLQKHCIPYNRVITNLPCGQRVLVNDVNYELSARPTAVAINMPRGAALLAQFLNH